MGSGGGPVEVEGAEVVVEEGEVPDAGEVIGFGDEEAGAVGAEGEGGDDGAEVVFDAGDGGAVGGVEEEEGGGGILGGDE